MATSLGLLKNLNFQLLSFCRETLRFRVVVTHMLETRRIQSDRPLRFLFFTLSSEGSFLKHEHDQSVPREAADNWGRSWKGSLEWMPEIQRMRKCCISGPLLSSPDWRISESTRNHRQPPDSVYHLFSVSITKCCFTYTLSQLINQANLRLQCCEKP